MAPRRPSDAERALWRDAIRDVSPLGSAPPLVAEAVPAPAAPPVATPPAASPAVAPHRPAGPTGAGLDRRSAQRLKRGQMAVEARLDLHGMTQAQAHGALLRFLARAHDDGLRAVLIITGKGGGKGSGEGVLRRAVPLWLAESECRARVIGTAAAQPKDGGTGALYVLLRRRRGAT
jgi:DNA-nicking Smr family endonuclease